MICLLCLLPVHKLGPDHIGIRLMTGAMENWGLIIYEEDRLKESDDLTITHEVSHQVKAGSCTAAAVYSDLDI